nr:MAG TPA: hypothetical protein [Caudoviricetes sp.]
MSEIVNCEYSKTIMKEPVCNAFDVNRYGEIICSEENCIILKLKEQLQAKEQECEELKEWQMANKPTGICETCTAKSVEDMYKYKQALDEIEGIADDYNRVQKPRNIIEVGLI